jgi:hypothetical protein
MQKTNVQLGHTYIVKVSGNLAKVKLTRLQNRATLYELAAIHPDGRRILIAYCGRRSRHGLLDACRGHAAALVALTGDKTIGFAPRAAGGATMGDWSIRFTGRTERDAIMEGELNAV